MTLADGGGNVDGASRFDQAFRAIDDCLRKEAGCGTEQLAQMQASISAEQSDLFDVLANVAIALPPLPR